mmetsp:Transcript_59970/g.172948  ORF Transcript_59970/g.172948 Transcript_59970/m.172948 type:complete len:284 (+) Transcript_59970:236-1087(+)
MVDGREGVVQRQHVRNTHYSTSAHVTLNERHSLYHSVRGLLRAMGQRLPPLYRPRSDAEAPSDLEVDRVIAQHGRSIERCAHRRDRRGDVVLPDDPCHELRDAARALLLDEALERVVQVQLLHHGLEDPGVGHGHDEPQKADVPIVPSGLDAERSGHVVVRGGAQRFARQVHELPCGPRATLVAEAQRLVGDAEGHVLAPALQRLRVELQREVGSLAHALVDSLLELAKAFLPCLPGLLRPIGFVDLGVRQGLLRGLKHVDVSAVSADKVLRPPGGIGGRGEL